MLTAVKVAFCICIIGVFEETVSWTIDLPQVRKLFFEKSLDDRERYDRKFNDNYQSRDEYPLKINPSVPLPGSVVYDNINTHSLHTYYDKYRDHYADDYKYHGYMEQKVHDAVRNGSAYLEGLRRAIEDYTRRLESCRRLNFTVNIIQFNPNNVIDNRPGANTPNASPNLTNILPNFPSNFTTITEMSTNFTNFMSMAANYTVFNTSDPLNNCMRADLASEHVRRLAQLAVWAASELQDKLYADKYDKQSGRDHEDIRGSGDRGHSYDGFLRYGVSGYEREQDGRYDADHRQDESDDHDDTLVLRLAWFLDRLAHLTGYDPKAEDFVEQSTATPTTDAPPPLSMVPTLVSNEDLLKMMSCMNRTGSSVERCSMANWSNATNLDSFMSRGWPGPGRLSPDTKDLRPSASENQEYTYSEQDFTDDDMPLSLPQPAKSKRKRSVQGDPLQDFVQYYAKYKAWTGANLQEKDSSEMSHVNSNKENVEHSNLIRTKRFVVKKSKLHKPEKPLLLLGSIVKTKLHIKKEKEVATLKKFIHKLHNPKTEVKLFKLKKSKRSVKYSKKQQPRVPMDPQGDISYYIKNKEGRSYTYNPVQAALVRAGLEQIFQTGNIQVVQRYGSNYNPANRYNILEGYIRGFSDV